MFEQKTGSNGISWTGEMAAKGFPLNCGLPRIRATHSRMVYLYTGKTFEAIPSNSA